MRFISCVLILLCLSCATQRYKMAKNGVKAQQVDRYFNLEENISVWLYMDYDNDVIRNGGVRVDNMYEQDAKVLKAIKLSGRNSKVLFSVKSMRRPVHQLVAIKHNSRKLDTALYERKTYQKTIYYQREYIVKDLSVRHAWIPYGKNYALSLVYYTNSKDQVKGTWSRGDYLARINAYALQEQKIEPGVWQVANCPNMQTIDYEINLNTIVVNKYPFYSVTLVALDGYYPTITYFKVVKDTEKSVSTRLCTGTYAVKYQSLQGDLVKVDTINISAH